MNNQGRATRYFVYSYLYHGGWWVHMYEKIKFSVPQPVHSLSCFVKNMTDRLAPQDCSQLPVKSHSVRKRMNHLFHCFTGRGGVTEIWVI